MNRHSIFDKIVAFLLVITVLLSVNYNAFLGAVSVVHAEEYTEQALTEADNTEQEITENSNTESDNDNEKAETENSLTTPKEENDAQKAPEDGKEKSRKQDSSENGQEAKTEESKHSDSAGEAEQDKDSAVKESRKEKTITTSDKKTYEITATYKDTAGIPMTGTELLVTELTKDDEDYDRYLEESAEKAGVDSEDLQLSKVFDISIVDSEDNDTVYEPTGDVSVSIKLVGTSLDDYDNVDVLHFVEEEDTDEYTIEEMKSKVDGETVEFKTDSFSVYVIVAHEGDENIETPRVTIHFISPITDMNTQENVEDGEYSYTSAPYYFRNKGEDDQCTQIVQNDETIELIANPPNQSNKFFYGWYVVDVDTVSASGDISYKWTETPKPLAFDTSIDIVDNGNDTLTMSWEKNSITYSETIPVDRSDYSAHIYVAPIYENYCFVNFHELAYAVSNASNLLTRKLVILGSDGVESTLVSDVVAQETDAIRRIFRGWQYRANNTWISVQTIDDHGNSITKSIDVTKTVDLYPYFQEGRWLYFNTGDSGNGARYVPAQFTLAEFDSQDGTASVGGEVTSLPATSRVGYVFGGWQVITDNSNPDNPVYTPVTDSDGNFLPGVDLSVNGTYLDNDGDEQTGVAYTIKDGKLTIKYPLNALTFYAKWNEKPDSQYTIVIWKQKVSDDWNAASNADKHYDYYALDALPTVIDSLSGKTVDELDLNNYKALTTNAGTRDYFTGFHLRDTDPVVMSDATVRGDGSTVVNIYYDRDVRHIYFKGQIATNPTAYNSLDTGDAYAAKINDEYFPLSYDSALRTWSYVNYRGETVAYTGSAYRIQNGNSNTLLTWTGLYGQTFSQVGYNWQTVSAFSWKNAPTNTIQTLLDTFNQDDGYTLDYNGKASTNNVVYHYLQQLDETYTNTDDRYYRIAYVSNNQFSFSDKFDGFKVDTYNNGNEGFHTQGGSKPASGSTTDSKPLHIYHRRESKKLTFDYNYPAASDRHKKEEFANVLYEAPLAKYQTEVTISEADIPEHYEFCGWYEDAAGTVPFDFDNETMPNADKIIYGKWSLIYYNVCIDPNGGVINHINFDESTDGANDTFYLGGFNADMSGKSEKVQDAWEAARAANGNDTSWVDVLESIGNGHNTSKATYFNAMYGTTIGEYDLDRVYVESDGEDDGTKFYYVNMQFGEDSGIWGVHADMRNALYLTAEQLEAYYKYCRAAVAWNQVMNLDYYDGTIPNSFEAFKDRYVKKNNSGDYALYEQGNNASYVFVGWYEMNEDGTLSNTPYNFSNAVENDLKLCAVWRKTGSYYLSYDPVYRLDLDGDTVVLNGNITAWTDPSNINSEMYNDGAYTTTLQQPTGITANGTDAEEDYIFRGWRIVKPVGTDGGGIIYEPLSDVYYEQAEPFEINADYADDNGCIHMQAVYQSVNASDRRPEIANLILDANGGYLTDGAGNRITDDNDITTQSGWGVGSVYEDYGDQQMIFGDMQSNDAVHLLNYAVTPGALIDYTNQSKNYFIHENNFMLLGFDEGSDYSLEMTGDTGDNIRTGEAFIPTYAADAVISVQRTDHQVLYAVWEPMVYVTFTNRMNQPVTFNIDGSGNSMSIVNEVTGVFSREKFTDTSVTLAAGESIKFVMPRGDGETFHISGTNTNTEQLMTVTSLFHDEETEYTTAGPYRSSAASFSLTDTLHTDPTGVKVYFDGTDTVFYDVKGGEWTDNRTRNSHAAVVNDASLIFVNGDGLIYAPVDIEGSSASAPRAPEPSIPTRAGYTFVGWTTNREAAEKAENDPAGYTLSGTDSASGINNMSVIKNNLLWDFDTEIDSGMTLYAVWSETITVRFHTTNNHTWKETDTGYFVPGSNVYTVTLAKGDILRQPVAPTWGNDRVFYRWVKGTNYQNGTSAVNTITGMYNFGEPVTETMDLYTSWIEGKHIDVVVSKNVENPSEEDQDREFTFTAKITTTTYTLTVNNYGFVNWNNVTNASFVDETFTFTLKDGGNIVLPLYYLESNSTGDISPTFLNSSHSVSIYFQKIEISEASDSNFTTTVSEGGTSINANSAEIDTQDSAPDFSYSSSGWLNPPRNYTYSATPKYPENSEVTIAFTNTREKTDVTVTKVVTPDDYITGDEEFAFTAVVKDRNGQVVAPAYNPTLYGYTVDGDHNANFTLKDGESVTIHGVPVGGSVAVTEDAKGYTAESTYGTTTGNASFTLENVSADGGNITYTNTRDTYDVTVHNSVPGYGSKTKYFTYTLTLWDGDEQVAFPSSIPNAGVTFTNNRKTMTVRLRDDESYTIKDLPANYKLEAIQMEEEDYDTTVGLRGDPAPPTESLTYKLVLPIISNAEIGFVNRLKTGSYKITKSVQLDSGTNTDAFQFTAKLFSTADSSTPVAISQEIKAMAEAVNATVDENDNIISFTLRHGEDITLSELPVGYFLQVQENAPGYAAYVNNIRTDMVMVPIKEGENSAINYINRSASTKLQILKLDEDDNSLAVSGAVFRLYNMQGGQQNTLFTLTSNADGWLEYTEASVTSTELSLENGTYYLSETNAPVGYKRMSEPIKIVINNTKDSDKVIISGNEKAVLTEPEDGVIGSEDASYTITVTNKVQEIAPTGFMAVTRPFTRMLFAGLVLFATMAIPVYNRRKRREEGGDADD